ncbi:helix-turn-helix domain-containing protein [Streptomyces sp. NPDC101152]|uniref:helix-turn-helix domain-containing protein n=1 Tax=Streptomyces sp. NPDC101152 TaxID=3366116 RepID=UPI00381EFA78
MSVEYYTRLERGNVGGVSPEVLDSLAAALQLDDVERAHLAALVRAAAAPPTVPPNATAGSCTCATASSRSSTR